MPGDARKACFKEDVLRDLFLALDSDGNGYLSYQELWNGLNGDDVRWDDASNADKRAVLDRLWLEADKDGSDQVTLAEFWQLIAASRSPTEDEMARAYDYFLRLDKSGDGAPRDYDSVPPTSAIQSPRPPSVLPRRRPVPSFRPSVLTPPARVASHRVRRLPRPTRDPGRPREPGHRLDSAGLRRGRQGAASVSGASHLTPVPIRPRRRCERRSSRTFAGASLRAHLAFTHPRPRRLSTPLLTPMNSTPTSL